MRLEQEIKTLLDVLIPGMDRQVSFVNSRERFVVIEPTENDEPGAIWVAITSHNIGTNINQNWELPNIQIKIKQRPSGLTYDEMRMVKLVVDSAYLVLGHWMREML